MTRDDAPRTIRVRIAVGIDRDGEWEAYGTNDRTDAQTLQNAGFDSWASTVVWVEADVPLPEPVTVEGTVDDG